MARNFPFQMLAIAAALANIQIAQADISALGESLTPSAVSGDGGTTVGQSSVGGSGAMAMLWKGTTATSLGKLSGFDESVAYGVSGDGSVVAGESSKLDLVTYNYVSRGFRWTAAGGMVGLSGLASGQNTSVGGISADGNVIVGKATLADTISQHAVRWTGAAATIQDINGNGFTYSSAQGVSGDGSVVVGYGQNADGFRAFRWASADGMTSLGVLTGKTASEATAVSADGQVITGIAYTAFGSTPDEIAFRWTKNGGMSDLGLPAGATRARPQAINSDGSVIVGYVSNASLQNTAFRWTQANAMQSVAQWLTSNGVNVGSSTFYDASGVSADGSVVVGTANIDGKTQAYIARVGSGSGSGSGSGAGVTTLQEQAQSFSGLSASTAVVGGFASMALFGAHHRVLADNGLSSNRCFWATGDLGGTNNGSNRQYLGEVGICGDFGPWRLGIGVGGSHVGQDLQLGGKSRLNGQHVYAEADYRVGNGLVASIAGFYGAWDAEINRRYMSGASLTGSNGDTNVQASAIRLRLDWLDVARVGKLSFSPFLAYGQIETHANAYTESTGIFAAQFEAYRQTTRDTRAGVTAAMKVATDTDLRLSAEAINQANSSGQLNASVSNVPIPIASTAHQENRARFGAEIDHRLSKQSVLNASMHFTAGSEASYVASVGWKMGF